jgi:hypothetical protein
MKVMVNGLEKKIDLEGIQNIEGVLEAVSKDELEPKHIITQVEVNNVVFPFEKQENHKIPFGEIQSVKVTSSSTRDVIEESLKGGAQYSEELVLLIKKISELYRIGKDKEANQSYTQMVDGLQRLIKSCEVIKGAIQLVRVEIPVEKVMVIEGKGGILELLNSMLDAQKDKDWILLADILEYELVPTLQNLSQDLTNLQGEFKISQ